jgi:4-amino-4-deoxy-L-arabinose transferase-like glycosyltransferase
LETAGLMLYVSILVELLRSRPALAVWLAVLLQAFLWTLVPALFYEAPPGDLATTIAIGHEFPLGTYRGPPLAFWLADVVYILSGHHLFGVYLLSQICVVVTYWAVFELGRAMVGAQQAALAVLLMAGMSAFTVPTPEFGPVILTMPLWAVILLHYWRAVGEGRRRYWVALAVEIGLLLLTTYAGLLLVTLLSLFTLVNRRARASLGSTDPWLAGIVAVMIMFPHLLWLAESGDGVLNVLGRLRAPESVVSNFSAWLKQGVFILGSHAGLAVLVALVVGWPWGEREPAPVIVRKPIDTFVRQFVYFFAILPMLASSCLAVLVGMSMPIGGIAPLVILSALAIVVAAGDGIELTHQRLVIPAWFGLVLVPPAMTVLAIFALPWVGIALNINQPARAMAQFFDESYQRRLGAPLPIVAGDPRTAALIAIGAPSRPSLFFDATPERSSWVTMDDLKRKGAILVWPTTDTSGAPPAALKARFPDIVPEVSPRAFERPVPGRLPLLRIGWAVIRPQGQPAAGGPAASVP